MNKRHYEHTLPNIRGSLSNTYLEILVEKLRVKTLRGKSVYSNTSPAYRYIREMYGKMVSEGRLVEGCKQTASGKLPLCRTATGRELKMKRREDDRTE